MCVESGLCVFVCRDWSECFGVVGVCMCGQQECQCGGTDGRVVERDWCLCVGADGRTVWRKTEQGCGRKENGDMEENLGGEWRERWMYGFGCVWREMCLYVFGGNRTKNVCVKLGCTCGERDGCVYLKRQVMCRGRGVCVCQERDTVWRDSGICTEPGMFVGREKQMGM